MRIKFLVILDFFEHYKIIFIVLKNDEGIYKYFSLFVLFFF